MAAYPTQRTPLSTMVETWHLGMHMHHLAMLRSYQSFFCIKTSTSKHCAYLEASTSMSTIKGAATEEAKRWWRKDNTNGRVCVVKPRKRKNLR